MKAKDIMTTTVATVQPEASIKDIAKLLLERRISAVLVVDPDGQLLGIVSEGDLMRRSETGTERHPSWWLSLVADPEERAMTYVRSHGGHASDVMTRDLVSVGPDAALEDVAETLEKHRIKRVPVLRDGELIGIVSAAPICCEGLSPSKRRAAFLRTMRRSRLRSSPHCWTPLFAVSS